MKNVESQSRTLNSILVPVCSDLNQGNSNRFFLFYFSLPRVFFFLFSTSLIIDFLHSSLLFFLLAIFLTRHKVKKRLNAISEIFTYNNFKRQENNDQISICNKCDIYITIWLGLFVNSISIPYGLFNAGIWLIRKYLNAVRTI